jgi:hypothetical protein
MTRLRAFKSDLEITLGALSFRVDLIPPRETHDEVRYESACPACHEQHPEVATKVSTSYHCPDDPSHGPFVSSEVLKATRSGQALKVVGTTATISEARKATDVKDDLLALQPYYADEVERWTYPLGTAYVLNQLGRSPAFPLLLSMLDHDGHVTGERERALVLVGEVTLRTVRKLVMLRRWNDQLVLQELVRPDDLKTGFTVHDEAPDGRFLALFDTLMDLETRSFDPNEFRNLQRQRLIEFNAAQLVGGPVVAKPAAKTEAPSNDLLLRLLEESVKAAAKPKARKANPRRASRKAAPARKVS